MRRIAALLTIGAALAFAGTAQADGLPSIYGPDAGPLTSPSGRTHPAPGWQWVQRNPIVHLVFWGPSWSHDTTGIVGAEFALFRELPGTAYGAILGQYGVRNMHLDGAFFDSRPPRGPVTYRALALEANRARRLHHWKNGAYVQWVILPSLGADMRNFTGGCGEHDDLVYRHRTYYVDLIPPFTDPHYAPCIYEYSADNGTHPPGNLVDATTSITTHEYAEAATDPWASTGLSYGWSTPDGNDAEVADLCAWYSGVPQGMTVNVSYLWSNTADACVA